MPYKVIAEAALILKSLGELKDDDGKVVGYDHVSIPHLKDDILEDSEISPVLKKLYEDADEHVRSVIVKVGEEAKDEIDDIEEKVKPVNKGGRPPKAKTEDKSDEAETSSE